MNTLQHKQSAVNTNSDVEERDRRLFNRIADEYFKKDMLPSSSLARRLRLNQTLRRAGLQRQSKIMEVGCGGGFSARYLQGSYSGYLGIDYSEKLITYAKDHSDMPNASFRVLNINDLEPEYNSFDIIFMIGVLHHMHNMDRVIGKLRNHLRCGGVLAVNEPQRINPIITLLRGVRKKTDAGYSKDQKELTAKDLMNAFKNAGYFNIRAYPQGLFSTPFAEVPLNPQFIMHPLSGLACRADQVLEEFFSRYLKWLSWNIVVIGTKPEAH